MIKTKIFAHRGASGLVPFENTIDAFSKAIELNCDGIELDVRQTKDKVMIINHNPDIGGLIIKDHTFDVLKEKAIKIGFKLATLEETLQFCQNKIFLDIEVKEKGFEQELITLIKQYLDYNQFFIRSFSEDVIIKAKEIDNNIKTVLLISTKKLSKFISVIFPNKKIKRTKCDIISPHYKFVCFGFIKRKHNKNIPVSIWTVNNNKDLSKFIKKNVDYIITNYPNNAIDILKKEK